MSARDVLSAMHETLLDAGLFGTDSVTLTADGKSAAAITTACFQAKTAKTGDRDDGDGTTADALCRILVADLPTAYQALAAEGYARGTLVYDGTTYAIESATLRSGALTFDLVRTLAGERAAGRYRATR